MTIEKETDNFSIKAENPEELQSGKVEARVVAKPLTEEGRGYDEKIKVTGRSVSEYTNNIQEIYELSEEDRTQLKVEIMKLKNDIRDQATIQTDNQTGSTNTSANTESEKLDDILHTMVMEGEEGEIEKEKLEHNADNILEQEDPDMELAIPANQTVQITDEGRQRVRENLGLEKFEGDPEAEAQQQLEDNPLQYYLDSFNKIHKGDHLLKIWELISAMSSTCADRQIHSWAVGPSGKGKSHLKRELLKFLPREAYTQKESFSPKALQYKTTEEGPGFMNNQLVYFDEVGENIEDAIELIRLLTDQDKDRITHETVKDQEIITLTVETGNITVWFTSVDTIQDEQLKNRFILTNPDASSAQDETVNQHQQNILNFGGDLDFTPKEAPVIQRIVRDIREETPNYKPIVPFKINWKQEFNRRLYPFFYTLMGMVAKIHYKNRETRDGYIFVTKADFELAKLIWGKLIDTTVAQTDEVSIKLLERLPQSEINAKTRAELHDELEGFSTNKVKRKCEQLEETEELQLINSKYEDGKYWHWAGADIEKLTDNQPEIREFNEDRVQEMIQEAGLDADDEVIDSIMNSEIPVVEFLKEKVEARRRREDTGDDEPLELTEKEKEVINTFKEYSWGSPLTTMDQITGDETDVIGVASDLEEKDAIHIEDDKPRPARKLQISEVEL